NPRAIVIGSAPNEKYGHPRGKSILELLKINQGQGHLWSETAQPHAIQYYCDGTTAQQIQDNFKQHNERIFDSVPNNSFEMSGSKKAEQWYLTWIDLPIYTLWTTGTLYFSDNIKSPIFAEVPSGLMNYVAVS